MFYRDVSFSSRCPIWPSPTIYLALLEYLSLSLLTHSRNTHMNKRNHTLQLNTTINNFLTNKQTQKKFLWFLFWSRYLSLTISSLIFMSVLFKIIDRFRNIFNKILQTTANGKLFIWLHVSSHKCCLNNWNSFQSHPVVVQVNFCKTEIRKHNKSIIFILSCFLSQSNQSLSPQSF